MAKKHLEQYDKNGNRLDIYLNEDEVMVGNETLADKLDEMDAAIEDAAAQGGIQEETDPTVPSWAKQPTKPTYTAQEVGALPANTDIPSKTSDLNNDSGFVTETEMESAIDDAVDGLGGEVSVTTNEDGTFVIHVGDTDYTINLNHTHENMAKLVVCEESDLPATLAKDTIYAQVDDAENPSVIETLYIAGIEFVGGGVEPGEPYIVKPGNSISLGTNSGSGVSKLVDVKGLNLTDDITLTVGTGLSLTYGQTTGSSVTIQQADAIAGVQVTIAYSGVGGLTDGSLVISGGGLSTLKSVTVTVKDDLPDGYTRLEYVDNIDNGMLTDVDAVVSKSPFVGTTWEVDVQMASAPSATNIILCSNGDVGHWFGAASAGYTLGGNINFSASATQRHLFEVKFIDLGLEVTCNGETKSRTNANGFNHWGQQSGTIFKVSLLDELNGPTANVKYTDKVYSIKCTSGGSFDGVPAQRISDGKKGLYDKANNVFHPLTT